MSEKPVPETLETIAAKIDALGNSVDRRFEESAETIAAKIDGLSKSSDERFAKVDRQFGLIDQQFAETRAQLGVKIEAVDAKVTLVYDEVIAMREERKRNGTEHKAFTKRLDNHDIRLLALEKPGPSKP